MDRQQDADDPIAGLHEIAVFRVTLRAGTSLQSSERANPVLAGAQGKPSSEQACNFVEVAFLDLATAHGPALAAHAGLRRRAARHCPPAGSSASRRSVAN